MYDLAELDVAAALPAPSLGVEVFYVVDCNGVLGRN